MLTTEQVQAYRKEARELFLKGGIYIRDDEAESMEIADMGLGRFEEIGLGILVYVNTERCCAKELAMWPRQTCPQHRHPPVAGHRGKEETFRCRWGTVYLNVPGEATPHPGSQPPAGSEAVFDVRHEIVLQPGDQYTLTPDTWHWFQAGDEGAVLSEFSTSSTDEADVFTDPEIQRTPEMGG